MVTEKTQKDLSLGLDASTQSISGVVINADSIIDEFSIKYDDVQPDDYDLTDGYWELENNVVYGSPIVWAMALEQALGKLKDKGLAERIAVASGSGQQHGSGCLRENIRRIVASLNPAEGLAEQLEQMAAFSRTDKIEGITRYVSPIWKDSSTTKYMKEIAKSVGGLKALVDVTGSGQFERFTGPQIRRFFSEFLEQYENTKEIELVSSHHFSLFTGKRGIAPGDAAGMMLMDISKRKWNPELLRATAPELEALLPKIVAADSIAEGTCEYMKKRFLLDAAHAPWEGDNPNSLIGVGAVTPEKFVTSLGTSDTFFGHTGNKIKADYIGEGCVFGAPTDFKDNMYLFCWKNGSLAREKIAEQFGMNWEQVSGYLLRTKPAPAKMGVYWDDAEITPHTNKPLTMRTNALTEGDPHNIKAIIEGKFMSMYLRLERINDLPKEIYVTAGASENEGILQTMADVFGVAVHRLKVSGSAALGAALRARHAYLKHIGQEASWQEITAPFTEVTRTFEQNTARHKIYRNMMIPEYKAFEEQAARMARI